MNRKEKIREYKSTPRPMGVYQIRNCENGRLLVGSSQNLPSIMNRFRMELSMGTCRNRALQNDWNEFGESTFEFETLELLEPLDDSDYNPEDDLEYLLETWLEKLSPYEGKGYNIRSKRQCDS